MPRIRIIQTQFRIRQLPLGCWCVRTLLPHKPRRDAPRKVHLGRKAKAGVTRACGTCQPKPTWRWRPESRPNQFSMHFQATSDGNPHTEWQNPPVSHPKKSPPTSFPPPKDSKNHLCSGPDATKRGPDATKQTFIWVGGLLRREIRQRSLSEDYPRAPAAPQPRFWASQTLGRLPQSSSGKELLKGLPKSRGQCPSGLPKPHPARTHSTNFAQAQTKS